MWKAKPLRKDVSPSPLPNRITSNSGAKKQTSTRSQLHKSWQVAVKIPKVSVKIGDVVVEMVMDTGATTDILDEATYRNIHQNEDTELQPTTKRLFAYGSDSQLTILGKFDATIAFKDKYKDKYKDTTIHVVQGSHGSLLSYKTAMDLGILDLHVNHVSDTVPVHEQLCIQVFSMALEGSKE